MPLQNRVDPWGRLHAAEARGTLLGNRGNLHNDQRRIVRASARKGWVTCRLEFEGRQRQVFAPGSYSELFFLDEATAFAAGHRPCAECRRDRYNEFKSIWLGANSALARSSNAPISEIDNAMHAERMTRAGEKVTFDAAIAELPDGSFFALGGNAFLIWKGRLLRWSFGGYSQASLELLPDTVRVLTPASIVRAFRAGIVPSVHSSAEQ